MIFSKTALAGPMIIELERHEDERGWFARTYCEREFAAHGLPARMVQSNLSFNRLAGTLRGMHYQKAPWAEDKLVRCAHGAVWDVIVDIRPDSPTRGQWIGVELSAANGRMLFVPQGFAHGFITLADDTLVHYQIAEFFEPQAGAGLPYDDPAFGIEWPVPVRVISDKDRNWPPFADAPAVV